MIVFLIQYKRRESLQRPFFLGLSIFMLGYGIARLIENIRRYSIGSYNDILDAWKTGTQIVGLNFWLRILYYAIAWAMIAMFYYNIEKNIFKKNKFLLTICALVEGVLSITIYFYFNDIVFWASVFNFFIVGFFIPILFLNLAMKTPSGSIRNGCILISIGMLLFVLGVMIDLPESSYFMYLLGQEVPEDLIRITTPIILIMGLLSFSIGFKTFFPKE